MKDTQQTISASQLREITGLTDRRHNQLVHQGFLPAAKRGVYPLVPALQGLIRFYRESAIRARSHLQELKEGQLERQNKKLDLELLKLAGQMIEVEVVGAFMLRISTRLKQRLYQFLGTELPSRAQVDPSEAARLAVLGRELADEMVTTFAGELRVWNQDRS